VSFERIVNIPKRGIGSKTMQKISTLQRDDMTIQDACREALEKKAISKKAHGALESLLPFLESLRNERPEMAIQRVLKETGYHDYLETYSGGDRTREFVNRMENIEFLLHLASQKETLEQYLDEVTLNIDDQEDKNRKGEQVTLSTVHGAKGLEWEAVFVVGVEEDVFPHWRSLVDGTEGAQEERRLMYVAMTRAERYLALSHALFRGGKEREPSRFLEETGLEVDEHFNS
jgi:DNA helicase-2/ATP-dependent DNA helicase PcrA